MTNQIFTGTPTSRRFVTLPATAAPGLALASSFTAGTPLLVGTEPCVLLDSAQAANGTVPVGATALFNGTFQLTVIANSSESPATGKAINPGDPIYATGTKDAGTNVTYGLTLDANSGNTAFGQLDPQSAAITSGQTSTTAYVRL